MFLNSTSARDESRNRKSSALPRAQRHAHERPQVDAVHDDANLGLRHERAGLDAGELRRRRAEHEPRRVAERNQREQQQDEAPRPAGSGDRRGGPVGQRSACARCVVSDGASDGVIHRVMATAPRADNHTTYGSTSPRCRTSVPALPLVKATTNTIIAPCVHNTVVSTGSILSPATTPNGSKRDQHPPDDLLGNIGAQEPGVALPRQRLDDVARERSHGEVGRGPGRQRSHQQDLRSS